MKDILEIPKDVATCMVTMRTDDNRIITGVAKGTPHWTETLALAFGTFVQMVRTLEQMNGPEKQVCQDLREVLSELPLEDVRDRLSEAARATRNYLDGRDAE